MASKLVKISKAAKIFGVHPNTLRQWDKKGILKAIRLGQRGDRRYKREDIKRFVDKKN